MTNAPAFWRIARVDRLDSYGRQETEECKKTQESREIEKGEEYQKADRQIRTQTQAKVGSVRRGTRSGKHPERTKKSKNKSSPPEGAGYFPYMEGLQRDGSSGESSSSQELEGPEALEVESDNDSGLFYDSDEMPELTLKQKSPKRVALEYPYGVGRLCNMSFSGRCLCENCR